MRFNIQSRQAERLGEMDSPLKQDRMPVRNVTAAERNDRLRLCVPDDDQVGVA